MLGLATLCMVIHGYLDTVNMLDDNLKQHDKTHRQPETMTLGHLRASRFETSPGLHAIGSVRY